MKKRILIFQKINKIKDINNKMEKEIAEFIGIMLGDGCIGIYNCKDGNKIKKQYQLKVTLDSRNKGYISYVFNLMKKILGVEPRIYFKKNENTADIRTFRKEKVLYALNKLKLKISPKWDKMEIPKEYLKDKLDLFVLRGLFDTDGSITIFKNNNIFYPRMELRISPSPAQKQIIKILDKYKFSYRIQNLEKGKIRIRLSGKKELDKWFDYVGSSNEIYVKRAKPFLSKNLKG